MTAAQRITVTHGDSREVLKGFPDNHFDSVVTDPPYALVSITKRFGKASAAPAKGNAAYTRASAGFMGQQWDTGETAFDPEFWAEVLRVLKPGGHVAAFSGTRTYHRMAVAIEDAGFEIRDQIGWTYGAGFPKSHNVKKGAGDRVCQCEALSERDLRSVQQSDVPTPEPIETASGKVLQPSVSEQSASATVPRTELGQGSARPEEQGVEGWSDLQEPPRKLRQRSLRQVPTGIDRNGPEGRLCDGTSAGDGAVGGQAVDQGGDGPPHRSQAPEQYAGEPGALAGQPESQIGGTWPVCGGCNKPVVPSGLGTALKPAWEPICLGRKPISGTVATNVLKYGTGALNIDGTSIGTRIGTRTASTGEVVGENQAMAGPNYGRVETGETTVGRWPANIIHDGSDEVVALFPDRDGSSSNSRSEADPDHVYAGGWKVSKTVPGHNDSGSAARFFYTAKADSDDRIGSKHPTVKPVDLMQWLVRLITPPGGLVLEPFAGSGTTGEAAFREGMRCVMIEREEGFVADIKRRISLLLAGPEERNRSAIKAKIADGRIVDDAGPLFGGPEIAPTNQPTKYNGHKSKFYVGEVVPSGRSASGGE